MFSGRASHGVKLVASLTQMSRRSTRSRRPNGWSVILWSCQLLFDLAEVIVVTTISRPSPPGEPEVGSRFAGAPAAAASPPP